VHKTIVKTIEVQWGDMDASQHVNNAVYFQWIESARVEFLTEMNLGKLIDQDRVGAVVAWQDCKYIRPVIFPDKITLEVRCIEILTEKIVLQTRIMSERKNDVVAISKQHIVPFDFVLRTKAPLPTHWLEAM